MTVIHVRIDGRPLCGVRPDAQAVGPRQAKFVTCKRCLAALHRIGS